MEHVNTIAAITCGGSFALMLLATWVAAQVRAKPTGFVRLDLVGFATALQDSHTLHPCDIGDLHQVQWLLRVYPEHAPYLLPTERETVRFLMAVWVVVNDNPKDDMETAIQNAISLWTATCHAIRTWQVVTPSCEWDNPTRRKEDMWEGFTNSWFINNCRTCRI